MAVASQNEVPSSLCQASQLRTAVRRTLFAGAFLAAAAPLMLLACGTSGPRATPQPTPTVSVTTVDGAVGVVRFDESRKVQLFGTMGGQAISTYSYFESSTQPTVHFAGFSYPDRNVSWGIAYGTAPAGAVAFQVSPSAVASALDHGVFVAAIRGQADTPAQQFRWSFLGAGGNVLISGQGELR